MQYKLSVIIPAKNEEFLDKTIQDVLEHTGKDTQIVAVLDGYIPNPPLTANDPRVTIIYNPESKGQRIASNQAAKISDAKYICKLDAHCAVAPGFDIAMIKGMEDAGDDTTLIAVMRNLHAFDWVCPNGHRRYQSPSGPCTECGQPMTKDICWIAKTSPQSFSYRFDKTMHFQYHNDYAYKQVNGAVMGWSLSFDTQSVPSGIVKFLTDLASSHEFIGRGNSLWFRENMPVDTVSLIPVNNGRSSTSEEILLIRDKSKVQGITTTSVLTNMVNDQYVFSPTFRDIGNEPRIGESMCKCLFPQIGASTITTSVGSSRPVPTSGDRINSDLFDKLNGILGGDFTYSENTNCFHNGSVTLQPVYNKDLTETMSIQGSCFMCTKEKYFELGLSGEEFNSWGQQGVEVACKTWLSGGRVMVNHTTWYAHMFRTQGGDFSFPYHNPQSKVEENRELSRKLFQQDGWPLAKHKFQWLIDKFNPPGWGITKGIIYYTPNDLDEKIAKPVRNQLDKISTNKVIPITSSSLKRMKFGAKNIYFPHLKKGYLTMFKQILGALENSQEDIVFFCEHDVLYDPSHFDFMPKEEDVWYYNQNVWMLKLPDGHALHFDVNQLSGLCVYRQTAIKFYKELIEKIEKEGQFDRSLIGFEPYTHNRVKWNTPGSMATWKSESPNIDIKHGANATGQRWKKEEYRNQKLLVNWQESDTEIPGWGSTQELVKRFQ